MQHRRVVSVVGPGEHVPDELLALAHQVGRLLAERGIVVLTGGRDGVMAAAARGAQEAHGLVLGLLPGTAAGEGNEFLDVAIPTGMGQARNALVAAADGLIAVGGSWGTLSEIALARRLDRPVTCLRGWQVSDHDDHRVPLETAATPLGAVDMLLARLGDRG